MSDLDESSSPLEVLKSQHSREKKELQAKITSLKHSINKNDKKKKKEVQTQIESIENELKLRQEKELIILGEKFSNSISISKEADEVEKPETSSNSTNATDNPPHQQHERKPTRAQLRRDRKAEEIKRKAAAELEDAANAQFSRGKMETDEINRALSARNLRMHEVAPDGDCMYNALAHQINKGREISGAQLRKIAAKYIRENRDDFLPFLTNEDGECLDEFGFEEYCGRVERTSKEGGAWGGEAELRAVSAALRRPVEVVQPDGCGVHFGDEFPPPPLIVTYHRFAYTLGEHYNSTAKLPAGG